MTPDVVVDIGNSRIKWGLYDLFETGPQTTASLPPDDPAAWDAQLAAWNALLAGWGHQPVLGWAVASVHPERLASFLAWVGQRGEPTIVVNHTHVINHPRTPLKLNVTAPEQVGIDRLVNALCARMFCPRDRATIVIDVGTAVTIDLIDEESVFQGGAILPGPRLMFEAMHRYTAKLPLIEDQAVPVIDWPGKNTRDAMAAGVMAAQTGALDLLVRDLARKCGKPPQVMMTGGALGSLGVLPTHHFDSAHRVLKNPTLTLEGIQLAADEIIWRRPSRE